MTDPPESAEAVHAALARIRADVESRLSTRSATPPGSRRCGTEVLGRSGTLTVDAARPQPPVRGGATGRRGGRQRDPDRTRGGPRRSRTAAGGRRARRADCRRDPGHDRARPAGPPGPPPSADDRRARPARDLPRLRLRGVRGAGDRERPHELRAAEHPARPPVARPVGHAVRGRAGIGGGGRAAAGGGRHDPPNPHLAGPDPGHARARARRSGSSCRGAAIGTRPWTPRTGSSSSRSRGSSSTATPAWPTSRAWSRSSRGRCSATGRGPGSDRATTRSPSRARRSTSAAWCAAGPAARPAAGPAG